MGIHIDDLDDDEELAATSNLLHNLSSAQSSVKERTKQIVLKSLGQHNAAKHKATMERFIAGLTQEQTNETHVIAPKDVGRP